MTYRSYQTRVHAKSSDWRISEIIRIAELAETIGEDEIKIVLSGKEYAVRVREV